jgi:hypothetical protein
MTQNMAIALTYKIKAAGSWQAGEIMVSVFLLFVILCWLCVTAFRCIVGHSNLARMSQAHPTQLLRTVHRTGHDMT